MNHRFLRDEAARFRTMADEADRETTKLRLLAMAADYEARANIAAQAPSREVDEAQVTIHTLPEETPERPDTAKRAGAEGLLEGTLTGESLEKSDKLKRASKVTRGVKETIMVERRPTTRRGKDTHL